jgi:hypothetical protein
MWEGKLIELSSSLNTGLKVAHHRRLHLNVANYLQYIDMPLAATLRMLGSYMLTASPKYLAMYPCILSRVINFSLNDVFAIEALHLKACLKRLLLRQVSSNLHT